MTAPTTTRPIASAFDPIVLDEATAARTPFDECPIFLGLVGEYGDVLEEAA